MSINTGGPAFPSHGSIHQGMTLRDYFAGQALAAMNYEWFDSTHRVKEMSHEAYDIADAMLAAREAKQ